MSYQFEYRHLHYFLAVAEELHFRKAAAKLYISQPGLSKQIKELEAEIGVLLFERSSRKVTLTKAGLYLKAEIEKHFKVLDHTIRHAQLLDQGVIGELNLGYVGSAMIEIIPELLVKFQASYPKTVFNLKEMDNQIQIEALLSREIDLGFVRLERVPRGLEVYPILVEPFCLALPKNHPLDSECYTSLKQLEDEPFILFDQSYSPSYFEKVMQIFDDSGFTPIVTHNTIHMTSIYTLIEHGFGISIVPKSLKMDHFKGVKFIELNDISQRTVLSAVWDPSNRNPMLGRVVEMVRPFHFAQGPEFSA